MTRCMCSCAACPAPAPAAASIARLARAIPASASPCSSHAPQPPFRLACHVEQRRYVFPSPLRCLFPPARYHLLRELARFLVLPATRTPLVCAPFPSPPLPQPLLLRPRAPSPGRMRRATSHAQVPPPWLPGSGSWAGLVLRSLSRRQSAPVRLGAIVRHSGHGFGFGRWFSAVCVFGGGVCSPVASSPPFPARGAGTGGVPAPCWPHIVLCLRCLACSPALLPGVGCEESPTACW